MRLGVLHQLCDGFRRNRRMHDQNVGHGGEHGDRREILATSYGMLRTGSDSPSDFQRAPAPACSRRAQPGADLHADISARARTICDHDRLAQARAIFSPTSRAERPRDLRGKGHDQEDRLGWIIVAATAQGPAMTVPSSRNDAVITMERMHLSPKSGEAKLLAHAHSLGLLQHRVTQRDVADRQAAVPEQIRFLVALASRF